MSTQSLKGNWNIIKGKLKQTYAHLTDDDLVYVEEREEELIGRLQRRLSRTKLHISSLLGA